MREGIAAVVLALVAACATGGEGSVLTSLGVSSASTTSEGASSSSADTTPESDEDPDGSADGTGSTGNGTTSLDGSGPGSSGDTATVDDCDAALETFAANPGWTASGIPDGGTMFGWSGTALAGGGGGEIGGTLQRSGNNQYYADTTIDVAAGGCIAAQGLLVAPTEASDFNSVIGFGHFSSSGTGPHIGFALVENPDSTLRVSMSAGGSWQVFVIEDIATPRMWSYEYDPVAGTMTLEMDGLGSESMPVDPADIGAIVNIDAFGMFKTPHETPEMYTGLLEVYLDEITYTR